MDVIKKRIRESGMTYKDVAKGMGLSEVSVKRLFSQKELTLQRLEQMTNLLSIDLYQLIEETKSLSEQVWRFTEEQENMLASDLKLYLFAFQIIHGVSLKEMMKRHGLKSNVVESYLLKLDKVKIIALRDKFKFKLLIPPSVTWNPSGPLAKKIVLPTLHHLVDRITKESSPMVAEFFTSKMTNAFFYEYKTKIKKLSTEIFMKSLNMEGPKSELRQVGVIMSICPLDASVVNIIKKTKK